MASSEDKQYTVTVTETTKWTLQIYASSSEEATQLVAARHESFEHYDEVYYDREFEAESDDEEEPPTCEEFEFNGIKYYKDIKTNVLYEHGDLEEELAILGVFNENKQCIEPYDENEE